MAEYGFAVAVSQKDLNQDPESTMASVNRVLRRNFEQYKEKVPELGDYEPVLLMGKCTTDDGYGEVPYAWYVNTEDPEQVGPENESWKVIQ